MARQKKEGKSVSLLMDKELFDRLEQYCENTYLTKTAAIEMALKKLFDEDEKHRKSN